MHDVNLKFTDLRAFSEAYRKFRGRDPNVDALMIKRGFPVNKK